MPQIGANFQFTSRQPNFERDQFDTIAHMAACTVCDEGHKCYCLENQKTYEFTSVDSNGDAIEPNETTGYWHEFSSSGSGDVTGATIGSGASAQNVTKVGGILQFPAYPTVPVKGIKDSNGNDINPDVNGKVTLPAASAAPISKIKVDGASDDLPINDGRVVIPSTPVKGIKTNGGTELTPDGNGKVTLPPIPADPTSRLTNIENTLQQIANAEPIVIPATAVELPTSANSTITYDSDDTYVMNISGTQIATVHYPYEHSTNSYLAFKAIDRDLYYVYQLTNAANNTYTFVEQHTYDELSHAEAKAVFEAGKYAVKQVIDVNNNGKPLPDGNWKHGIPSVFITPHGYPLRYNQIKENNVYYVLLKCDEVNKIFKYSASNNKWSLVSGGCYTKNDITTGENYEKYDAYFDRQPASNVSFDDSVAQLGTQQDPVTDVQTAINQLATGVQGLTGKLKVRLLYQNSAPVANKAVSISVSYRGASYDISSQYSPSTEGFITDSDGYVINNNSNEYLVLPLGATYTITLYDISDNYITPETKNGIIDANTVTVNCIYNNVSNVEFVKVYVQTPNTPSTIANVENKKVYVDFYSSATVHALQYVCLLRANGTIKQILEADGTTQATDSDGEPLISESEPVLIPVPNGQKYTCALQEWDETLSSENQRYVKSANQTYTASKAKRTLTFTYLDKQVGLFLLVKDSNQTKGYRSCLITEINSTTDFKINDVVQNESVSYIISRSNSNVYRQVEGDSNQELWEEDILGVGVRTSQNVSESNDDLETQSEYPDCSFFVPFNIVTVGSIQMLTDDTVIISLPTSYGGLYITKCLYNVGPSPTSPAAHKLIDETTLDITLQTPNSNKTIKGFIPTSPQILVIRGCLSNFKNIWTIITGNTFSIPGTKTNIWSCSFGTSSSGYKNLFNVYVRSTLADSTNPGERVGSVQSVLFPIYPF